MIWPELDAKIRAFASAHRVPNQAERVLIEIVQARAALVTPELPSPNLEWNAEEKQLELSWFSRASMQTLTFYFERLDVVTRNFEWNAESDQRGGRAYGVRVLHLMNKIARDHEIVHDGEIDRWLKIFWDCALAAREGTGQ